jgi:hypothetical protein
MAAFLDSELTVVKNAEGMPTALGIPVNSLLLQQNKPLFASRGGGKRDKKYKKKSPLVHEEEQEQEQEVDYANLAIPSGLVCMTQTICRRPEMLNQIESDDIVPESLYDKLMALAEEGTNKITKKQTRKREMKKKVGKTQKRKQTKRRY